MSSPETSATFFRASQSNRSLSDRLVHRTVLAFGTLASLLGIAAGSVVMFGLIIRAQPDGEHPARKTATRDAPGKSFKKVSNKVLVMRASAK